MATYNLTSSIPAASSIRTGDILNCPYSGTYKTIILPKGTYKLECWGAQGGNYSSYVGGKGGYSYGTLTLLNNTTIYLYSGGVGTSFITTTITVLAGGYNGGGSCYQYDGNYYASSGGGSSDIRIGSTSLYARVIVAGAGGGSGYGAGSVGTGGAGGGLTGLNGTGYSSYSPAGGGTQTAGGTKVSNSSYSQNGGFGIGGNQTGSSGGWVACGAGAGWYGGGSGGAVGVGGAGGSGYVYTSSTYSNYPSGCLLNSTYYLTSAATVAGNTSFVDYSGSTVTGHQSNGAIRITVIEVPASINLKIKINNTIKSASSVYVKINGVWKQASQIKTNINGIWK